MEQLEENNVRILDSSLIEAQAILVGLHLHLV